MPTTSQSVTTTSLRQGPQDLFETARLIEGILRTPQAKEPKNAWMGLALPLVAAAARHTQRAITTLETTDSLQAMSHTGAAFASFTSAASYRRNGSVDCSDFNELQFAIEAVLREDVAEAQRHAKAFMTSMWDFHSRISGVHL
jgi:hypothetical protein